MDSRCPKGLKCLPEKPCELGREARDAARDGKVAGCPFFVADRESNYCLFRYLADNGRPTSAPKVARLAMIDENEVKQIQAKFRKAAALILNIEPKKP
jgi:hypothetical protein